MQPTSTSRSRHRSENNQACDEASAEEEDGSRDLEAYGHQQQQQQHHHGMNYPITNVFDEEDRNTSHRSTPVLLHSGSTRAGFGGRVDNHDGGSNINSTTNYNDDDDDDDGLPLLSTSTPSAIGMMGTKDAAGLVYAYQLMAEQQMLSFDQSQPHIAQPAGYIDHTNDPLHRDQHQHQHQHQHDADADSMTRPLSPSVDLACHDVRYPYPLPLHCPDSIQQQQHLQQANPLSPSLQQQLLPISARSVGYQYQLDGSGGRASDATIRPTATSAAFSATCTSATGTAEGFTSLATAAPRSAVPSRAINWNERFQAIYNDYYNRRGDMAGLLEEFGDEVETIGKIIISERFLPQEARSIRPLALPGEGYGTAGGEKYACLTRVPLVAHLMRPLTIGFSRYLHSGIFFKYAVDTMNIYGGTENAMKSASHGTNSHQPAEQ